MSGQNNINSVTNYEKEHQLLISIIENSTDAIQISDKNLVTVMVNKAYEILTGIDRSEQLGISTLSLVEQGLISESAAAIVRRTGQARTIIQTFSRTGRSAHVTCKPLFGSNGEIEYYICNDRDLNEINSLIKELETTKTLKDHYKNELALIQANDAANTGFIADDENTLKALGEVLRSASSSSPVLLYGETGVGKTELARILHLNSPRSMKEFVSLNCASISEEEFDKEFFGVEGNPSIGKSVTLGILDAANGGSLLLDELAELPISLQGRLLNVIQNQTFTRVGGATPVEVDIRFISATNENISKLISNKSFRKDLYYRLNVISIEIPPLRVRKNDIIPLSLHFLEIHNKRHNTNKEFAPGVLYSLLNETWEGNIRQLRNEIEHAMFFSNSDVITSSDFRFNKREDTKESADDTIYANGESLQELLNRVEYKNLKRAYDEYKNVRDAAKSLGMSTTTFQRHLTELGKRYK